MQNLRWKDWLSQAERDLEWAKSVFTLCFFCPNLFCLLETEIRM
ncbi:toxin-antitoxin system, antitoxin component domain protein [Leptospira interrogans serovar Bataviae]|nr:toxin-antitoxin system, antitoxin component domain protein [Leptospira interrogans serovar Bataviae]OAM86252.1 toxin-antitoxin system, antitoxin component domain protein [Leptospira interrogans serovar Bataviae]